MWQSCVALVTLQCVKCAYGWQYDPPVVALSPQALISIICELCVTQPLCSYSFFSPSLPEFLPSLAWMTGEPVNTLRCVAIHHQIVQ